MALLTLYAGAVIITTVDAFRSVGKINSETKPEEKSSPKSDTAIQRQVKELLGREFRTVKNGLDPDEVMAFLETVAGSSEAALKRIELALSSQRLFQTIERMVEETRQISEHIKEEVKQEAEAEKAKTVEEAHHKAEEMVKQAKKSWSTAIEGANSVLLEAQRRAEEMIDQTKKSRSALIESINSVLKELSTSPFKGVETPSDTRDQKTVPAEEHVPELAKVDESEKTLDSTPEPHLTGVGIEGELAPLSVEADAVAPKEISPIMYSGKVILAVPQGAGPSWMEQLRQRLHNIRGGCILLDTRTNTGGSIIDLSLGEPTPLVSILLEMPNVERVVEDYQKVEEYSGGVAKILSHHVLEEPQTMLAVVLREDNTG